MSRVEPENTRRAQAPADPQFMDRWSPRALASEPIAPEDLASLFEAARWAPSCFNEQPWLFLYAVTPEDHALFLSCLVEFNQRWAGRAPVLMFVLAKKRFTLNGEPNRWAAFDAGAAWVSLALQARKLGLFAHAMAGFDGERAHEVLRVPRDDYDILAAVAVGKYGDPGHLPPDMGKSEFPNGRKPLSEVALEGTLPR
jgi:nitroreductase